MALLGREFIAVPDDRKGQIVFKWPDITIRRFTRAIAISSALTIARVKRRMVMSGHLKTI